jgi:DNA-binding NtrC family response regulator
MAPQADTQPHGQPAPESAPRILVVDDDLELLKTLEEYLVGNGFSVVCSSSAAGAIALVKEQTFSLVLVDWRLNRESAGSADPGTGSAVLKACRERDPLLPVIVMSGYEGMDVRTDAVLAEADSFLAKPFSFVLLANHLRHWLTRTRAGCGFWKLTREEDILPFEEAKRLYVIEALRLMGGNVAAAARKLGLHRHTVAALLEAPTGNQPNS